jgi:4-amino-4-deoxy-L-arabinose transferase-like glycosyltransferase
MTGEIHRLRPWHWAALAVIFFLALGLRLHDITRQSLSNDELGTMETAAGRGQIHLTLPRNVLLAPPPQDATLLDAPPVWKVPVVMQSDVHPPLYFVLLRLWQDIFGGGDARSRALSALAGAAATLLLFDVGRLFHSVSTGLWAALLMALSQPQIGIAQDARPYAMAMLFLLAAVDALLRIDRLGITPPRAIALAASAAAASLTHYFVLPVVVTIAIYALLRMSGRARRNALLALIASGALVPVLWGHGLWSQRNNFSDPWMYWNIDNAPHHVTATLLRAAGLPIRFLADPYRETAITAAAAVIYLLPWLLLRRKPEILLPALWLISCVAMMTALDLSRGTLQLSWVKYTIFGAPALYLILPMIGGSGWLGRTVALAAVLYCVQALPQAYQSLSSEPDYRRLAADVDRLSSGDEPILFAGSGWGEWYTADLYMGVQRYARILPTSVALLQSPVPPPLLAELARQAGGRKLLLVEWTNHPLTDLLPGWKVDSVIQYTFAARLFVLTPPPPN